MGSHYIPVGKIKIDKEILDIACPAAGYGETPPPPEIYCPANGFVDPNDSDDPWEQVYPPYVPEEGIPEISTPLSEESIIFIVNNAPADQLNFYIYRNTGNYIYEIYGADDVLIETDESTLSNFTKDFSLMTGGYIGVDGYQYFKVILKPTTGNFTECRPASTSNYYPLIEAYIDAPNLTILSFEGCRRLKKVWCCDTMDSLNQTTAYEAFYNTTSLEEIRLPLSMASQTHLEEWFYGSNVPIVVLPANMPALTALKATFMNSNVKKVILPTTCPLVNYLWQTFSGCSKLKEVTFSDDFGLNPLTLYQTFYNSSIERVKMPATWSTNNINSTFYGCVNLITNCNEDYKLEFYCDPAISMISSPTQNANKIKKVHYIGTADNVTSLSQLTIGDSLEEVMLPSSLNGLTTFNGIYTGHCVSLKKIIMPLSMNNLTSFSLVSASTINLEEITTCNDWGSNVFTGFVIGATFKKLKRIWQPTYKASQITLNGASISNPNALEEIELDWAFPTNISLRYNNLPAAEINRIFSALPTVSGTEIIHIYGNPGTNSCDPSIAQAKGWTVSGV